MVRRPQPRFSNSDRRPAGRIPSAWVRAAGGRCRFHAMRARRGRRWPTSRPSASKEAPVEERPIDVGGDVLPFDHLGGRRFEAPSSGSTTRNRRGWPIDVERVPYGVPVYPHRHRWVRGQQFAEQLLGLDRRIEDSAQREAHLRMQALPERGGGAATPRRAGQPLRRRHVHGCPS